MYILYNATLQRPINYNKQLYSPLHARNAIRNITQRKYSCVLAINTRTTQVVAIRKSAGSTVKFPRNYFANNYVYYDSVNNWIFTMDVETGEVYNFINIAQL